MPPMGIGGRSEWNEHYERRRDMFGATTTCWNRDADEYRLQEHSPLHQHHCHDDRCHYQRHQARPGDRYNADLDLTTRMTSRDRYRAMPEDEYDNDSQSSWWTDDTDSGDPEDSRYFGRGHGLEFERDDEPFLVRPRVGEEHLARGHPHPYVGDRGSYTFAGDGMNERSGHSHAYRGFQDAPLISHTPFPNEGWRNTFSGHDGYPRGGYPQVQHDPGHDRYPCGGYPQTQHDLGYGYFSPGGYPQAQRDSGHGYFSRGGYPQAQHDPGRDDFGPSNYFRRPPDRPPMGGFEEFGGRSQGYNPEGRHNSRSGRGGVHGNGVDSRSDPLNEPPPNHYETLGITPRASPDEVAKAAKIMRIKTHPDRLKKPDTLKKEAAKIDAKAAKVGQAADVLMNPVQRMVYDAEVRRWIAIHGRQL